MLLILGHSLKLYKIYIEKNQCTYQLSLLLCYICQHIDKSEISLMIYEESFPYRFEIIVILEAVFIQVIFQTPFYGSFIEICDLVQT